MAQVREVARVNDVAYGVAMVVCRNGEVARLAMDLDDEAAALYRMDAAGRAITDAGYDYDWCADFRAYNGGPRTGLVDAVYYVADVYEAAGDEPEELSDWRRTWQRGAGAVAIPAAVVAAVESVVEAAMGAAQA